jgi:hypothetical protein
MVAQGNVDRFASHEYPHMKAWCLGAGSAAAKDARVLLLAFGEAQTFEGK